MRIRIEVEVGEERIMVDLSENEIRNYGGATINSVSDLLDRAVRKMKKGLEA